MKLNSRDLDHIMRGFPNVKLSYVKNIHKKVSSADIFVAIPRGGKFFAWFRNFKKYSVCFLLEQDRRKNGIRTISIKNCCFDENICTDNGTLVHGTVIKCGKQMFFSVEDIFLFKGMNFNNKSQRDKLDCIHKLFKNHIKQTAISKNEVIFGLPIMTDKRDDIDKYTMDLPYNVYCIQHRYLKDKGYVLNERYSVSREYRKVFVVNAEIPCDIYTLSFLNEVGGRLVSHKSAFIADYKTSVFMNDIFRDIKENDNLDRLEESDDEAEFENVREDKFVNREKRCIIECVYNERHKGWIPLKHLEEGDICKRSDILQIEKNNRY